jgi:hypothetical protein
MHFFFDPDEWESFTESTPCRACGGDLSKCIGMCTGSCSTGLRRREPAEIARIKAERRRREEDDILAKAEAIKAQRAAL